MSSTSTPSLNHVCEFIVDCLHNTAPTQPFGIPLIRTPNIGKGRLFLDDVFRVSEEIYDIWTQRAIPEPGDLILAREAPAGNIAIVKEGQKVCLGQRTVHLRPNRKIVDPDFLCYFLLAPEQQGKLLAGETGATAKHVNMKDIRRLELLSLPDITTQKTAGSILSTYDNLIENNRRRMALLEDAARQVYQEWFVRLHFPGYEHTSIMDGVPEGWQRKKLDDLSDINRENLNKSADGEIEYIDIASVSPGQINETTRYDLHDAPSRARRVVKHGDIIWSCVRPNRRSHAVIWNPPENLIVSTGFVVISPSCLPTSFLYQALTTDLFVGYLRNHAKGAAYPAVVAGDFERAEVLVPKTSLVTAYNDIVEPQMSQIHNLRLQNMKLRTARDLLLPKLMSGEISV
jgi:type I restriction enzyme S subunit